MKTFATFFEIFTKKFLRNPTFLLSLIILPVVIFGVTNIKTESNMVAGVLIPSSGELEKEILNSLLSDPEMDFVQYTDEEKLRQDVANSTINAGYIFSETFTEDILSLNTKNCITLIFLENDPYHSYINPVVFTCVYEKIATVVTADFLEEYGISLSLDEIWEEISYYISYENAFEINIETLETETLQEDNTYLVKIIKGIICLFLVGFMLITVADLVDIKKQNQLFVPYTGSLRFKIYTLVPVYFSTIISAICGILIMWWTLGANLSKEIFLLLGFQVVLIIISLVLSTFAKKNTILVLTPIILIFIFASHPIIFDITNFYQNAEIVLRILPSYWYLTF